MGQVIVTLIASALSFALGWVLGERRDKRSDARVTNGVRALPDDAFVPPASPTPESIQQALKNFDPAPAESPFLGFASQGDP